MPEGYVSSQDVIGQPVEAIRYGLRETVIYLANGKQIIVEARVENADCKKGNPYGIVSTVVV